MRQIIQEILEGNFRADNTSLSFSCPRIDISMAPDSVQEGSFTIYGPEGFVTEGRVISSDLRMECLTPEFTGIQDEIYYRIDTTDMQVQDTIKGSFYIESNQGEYYLPFSVTIVQDVIDSSLGEIRNLFHFINLAKTNWDEAVRLFYSMDFIKLLTGNDAQYYTIYKGLSAVYGNEHNMEEFLLETGKKKAIEYIPEKNRIEIDNPEEEQRYTLTINRNGWGCTRLDIETDGDFIYVEDETVRDEDFLGNVYRLYYYIQKDKLHRGNNYGCIRLRSFEKVIEIPITVINLPLGALGKHKYYIEKKQITAKLMKYYQAYRLKKIGGKAWMEETEKLVDRLKELDVNDPATDLFYAQLLMAQERNNEAKWVLEQIRDDIEVMGEDKPEYRCFYLYLSTLYSDDDEYIDGATDEIIYWYERNRGNWRIAWLLLFLSDERVRTPARKWALLEELFEYNCNSPMLYMEAWNLLCMNPATLLKLNDFELQILTYAVKNDVMKDEVLLQLIYLTQKTKGYSGTLLRILINCYEKSPQSDILHAICTLLIKGNKYGKSYLRWYRLGVSQNLRITRLYEYFMMSVPLNGKETIPQAVLMYFAYQSDLSYEIIAHLYAYVHKRQEEYPDIYLNYMPEIEKFVQRQAKAGRINKDLAYLYRHTITQDMMDEEMAAGLKDILFLNEIIMENDNEDCEIRNIIVVYPYAGRELTYSVNAEKVQVPVFDKECRIILEDSQHNRYSCSIPFHMEKLLTADRIEKLAAPFAVNHLGYAVHACYGSGNEIVVNEHNLKQFKYLADSDFLDESSRRDLRIKLMHFYYEKDRMWELDEYLQGIGPEDIAPKDRKEAVRILVLRGLYQEARDWVRFGMPYGIDAKTLAKLCSRLLEQDEFEEDPLMTSILSYVVKKGKYNEYILKYLVRFFNGNIKDMRDIWKIAVEFGVDTFELSERILIQMLYTGAYIGEGMDIFKSYMKSGGSDEVIVAFLAQNSYDYVIKEKITDASLTGAIFRMYHEGAELLPVCKLAYLKYYSENRSEIDEEIQTVIREFLREMLERQMVLPLFKEYQGYLPALDIMQDKSILEYRARPGNRVAVHYMITKDENPGSNYIKENMRDIFAGICVKEFVLFFGENLQYYITEEEDGEEKVTLSGSIRKSDLSNDAPVSPSYEGSRFNMLNDIMIGKTLHDYDTVDKLLEEYYKKDFIAQKVFKLQ